MMKKKPKWILLTAMILMLAGILAVCVLPKMIRDKDICEEAVKPSVAQFTGGHLNGKFMFLCIV